VVTKLIVALFGFAIFALAAFGGSDEVTYPRTTKHYSNGNLSAVLVEFSAR
jgi:hypothetical protein